MTGVEMIVISSTERSASLPEKNDLLPIVDSSDVIENTNSGIIEKPDISFIERTMRTALIKQNSIIQINIAENNGDSEPDVIEKNGLNDNEKAKIKDETGWSDEMINSIQNMNQYEVLKNGGLFEAEINGRKCLLKENIDLDYTDADGISNRDRIERGLAPLDSKTGKPLELHHLGQSADSPLVELTEEEHRTGEYQDGKKNQSLWHDNTVETEVHGEGNSWNQERKAHWKSRSEQSKVMNND